MGSGGQRWDDTAGGDNVHKERMQETTGDEQTVELGTFTLDRPGSLDSPCLECGFKSHLG